MKSWCFLLLLIPAACDASTVSLHWTNPAFNAADSCGVDSTKPLLDLASIELTVTRIPQGDELVFHLPAAGKAGALDSCALELADSIHYVVANVRAQDGYGNTACPSNYELIAIPARDWQPGLQATYYNNEDLTAQYGKRVDPDIAFTWGQLAPLPGMGTDTFSEHWEGQINFPSSGVWSLSAIVEDGWRGWVGGVYVMNDFAVQNVHESSCQFNAEAGWAALVIEGMHHNGNAELTLSWTPPGGVKVRVPESALRH